MLSFGPKYCHGFQPKTLKLFQNLQKILHFSTSTSTSTSTNTTTQVFSDYLVKKFGFSNEQAVSISTKVSKRKVNGFIFYVKADCVIHLLKQHGFDETHLRNLVSVRPKLLLTDADKTLKPKFVFLQDQGFSGEDIVRVVSLNPTFLFRGLDTAISPVVKTLREVMGSNEFVVSVISKLSWEEFPHVIKHLGRNVCLLRSYGVPIKEIRKQLLWKPRVLFRKPEAFENNLIRVENKFGIPKDSPGYLRSVCILSQYSEATIESKCGVFKSFGWTESQVETVLLKHTSCFTLSEATIKKKLNVLMNELGLDSAYLTSRADLLSYNLERRLVPRHKVLLILKEKCLMRMLNYYIAMGLPESCFLRSYVLPFKDVHEVYARHTGCDPKMLSQGRVGNLS